MEKFSILYVDDEETNLRVFKNTFRREYNIFTATNALEGMQVLEKEKIDLILSDQRMPEITGVEFLKMSLEKFPKPNRILITAYTDFEALQKAINEARIFQYVQKPWSEDTLAEVIKNALELYVLKKENIKLNRELLQKNQQLETLNEELLKLDKLKSEFLSIISHEIRTPLNSLIVPFQLLKSEIESATSENTKTYIRILDNAVTRLEKFALNAERITKLKARKYVLNMEAIELKTSFENIIKNFTFDINSKKIEIVVDVDDKFFIRADFKLYEFCIEKLIENAVKHNFDNGKIKIKAYKEGDYNIIEISNTGNGFSEEALKDVFKIFSHQNHIDKNIGVDLSLVSLILEAHKGKILAQNIENGALVKLFYTIIP